MSDFPNSDNHLLTATDRTRAEVEGFVKGSIKRVSGFPGSEIGHPCLLVSISY